MLAVRHPAQPAGEPVREVEHCRDLRDVHDLLVVPAGVPQSLDVPVGAAVGRLGELHREVEHRPVARLEIGVLVARRRAGRQSPDPWSAFAQRCGVGDDAVVAAVGDGDDDSDHLALRLRQPGLPAQQLVVVGPPAERGASGGARTPAGRSARSRASPGAEPRAPSPRPGRPAHPARGAARCVRRRSPSPRSTSLGKHQPITDTPFVQDVWGVGQLGDLPAQARGVRVERPGPPHRPETPDVAEQVLLREHAPRLLGQPSRAARTLGPRASAAARGTSPTVRVERSIASSPASEPLSPRRWPRAAQHGPDPGAELLVRERPVEVVVRPALERADTVDGIGLAGAEQDHRDVAVPRPARLAGAQAASRARARRRAGRGRAAPARRGRAPRRRGRPGRKERESRPGRVAAGGSPGSRFSGSATINAADMGRR